MIRFFTAFYFLLFAIPAFSQDQEMLKGQVEKEKLPVPKEKNQLFYLQRDPDENTVIYALNVQDGELNEKEPVHAYWIRYADQGQEQKLSFIQRRMAYGINHKQIDSAEYDLHIQAYKALKITLSKKNTSGKYKAYVDVKGKPFELEHIFVRINGGSLFKPNIQYIEITCKNPQTGKKLTYQFDL